MIFRLAAVDVVAAAAGAIAFFAVSLTWFAGSVVDPVDSTIFVVVFFFALPLIALTAVVVTRRTAPSLLLSTAFPLAWWGYLVYGWSRKSWNFYGTFPWQGVSQKWLPLLPAFLATGVAFWLLSSWVFPRRGQGQTSP